VNRAAVNTIGSVGNKIGLVMPDALCHELEVKVHPLSATRRVYLIDPLNDSRWRDLLAAHPDASLFHSVEWLEALRRTYGYEPIVYTTSAPGQCLENGLALCRIDSWLTGRRLVSLPFSDHCAPLVRREEDLHILVGALQEESHSKRWRYIEMRPLEPLVAASPLIHPSAEYTLHQVDLRPDLDVLFGNLHKNSIQRKIKRAEREGVRYEEGSTASFLTTFYRLLIITRRRHRLPPQPLAWFRNLVDCFGKALKIRVAVGKDGQPVAGMLTIRHGDTMVYKYGGSDLRFNSLGGMHLLYWRSIQDAKASGCHTLDLGRSDADQAGLITFKNRWGAEQSRLSYCRLAPSGRTVHIFDPAVRTWRTRLAKHVFSLAPARALSVLGAALYKHVG